MTYQEAMVQSSIDCLKNLQDQLKVLDDRRETIKNQISQVRQVLRVLGAENRLPIAVRLTRPETEETVKYERYGAIWFLSKKILQDLQNRPGTWRTADVLALTGGNNLAQYYIAYLLEHKQVIRIKRGTYQSMPKTQKPFPPEKPIQDETGERIRVVDGVVTLEEPQENDIGR